MPAPGLESTLPREGQLPATRIYSAIPPGARRGMVVVHEIFGPSAEIDRVVERFGAAGYAAVSPDLFAGCVRPVCLVRAFRAIASGEGPQIEQLRRARRWLVELCGIPEERVGLIGFCLGGGFALAAGRGWGAVSTNYGEVPSTDVMRGIGPVIGCYGGRDRLFGRTGEKLRRRLERIGVPVETHVFPEVGHSFLTDGHHPIAAALSRPFFQVVYNPEVAEEGWRRIMAFFDRHLPADGA